MPDNPLVSSAATPVIIAGAPRSGTTFLTTALNAHPQVMITNELRAWIVFNDIRKRTEKANEALPDHPLREQFRRALIANCRNTFISFYQNKVTRETLGCPAPIYGDPSVEPVIKAFGDKNPSYADPHSEGCLKFIASAMTNAKFIHIHRDPRSCAASYKEVQIYAKTVDRWISIWKRHTQSMVDLRDKLGHDRVMQFAYEDFVSDKGEDIFRRIETFLGVATAVEPIEFLRRERAAPTPFRSPTTPTEHLGRTSWGNRLTPEEIEIINDECAGLVSRLRE